jgi:DNA-directed RNA polymerase subunit RPC12/RpoP
LAAERTYVAPCPACGAPVEFRSAQSAFAVCSYCRSTVVRDGDTLSRIGKVAEVFEDFSPLQLLARGRWQGRDFTLVGRLQYRGGSGAWTEWHALFADGSSAWLAEDNGAYVMALPATTERALPQPQQLRLGATTAIDGRSYKVASNEQVALVSAQGELPKLPPLDTPFAMVELRSADNEVLAIDYGSAPPALSRGRPVALEELLLTGLREDGGKAVQGRQFACPNCGAPVGVLLASSKSVTCPACNTLIDLSQGIGGELKHALQDEPVQPLIPLGSSGQLQGVQWQVVGYQHRLGTEPDDPDEHFGWDEYLLYNARRGFTFLVDSTEGWSLVKPTTGAPTVGSGRKQATYLGTTYQGQYAYKAETTYVAGEFYWPVVRGQTSFNRDYAQGKALLSMEETPTEVTWSVGSQVESDAVARAFGLEAKKDLLQRGDAGPLTPKSSGIGCGCGTIVLVVLVILILLALLKACEDQGPGSGYGYSSSSPRSSTGGFSGGGGSHK